MSEEKIEDEQKKNYKDDSKKNEKRSNHGKKFKFGLGLKSIWNDFCGEYKKITWPNFKNLCKQTYTVIVTCLFFGVIIFCVDAAYGFCFEYMVNLLSGK